MTALNYPAKPWADGDIFTDNGIEYIYIDDGFNPGYWSATTPDGVSVIISETAPPNPNAGDLWWNSNQDSGRLFIWYEDENTSQWVDASPAGAGGDSGDEYILPIASDSVLGGIKVGSRLTITPDGTLNADIQGGGSTTVGNLQEVTDEGNTTTNGAEFGEDVVINDLTVGRGAGNVSHNTVVGNSALLNNTTGNTNTAVGRNALNSNTEGGENTALGVNALLNNDTGGSNTAIGRNAGQFIEGSNNTILGAYQGTSADASLNDTVIISAGPTERMRIDSDGNVLIGGTLPATPNISLNEDGSGEFAGDVVIKGVTNRPLQIEATTPAIRFQGTGASTSGCDIVASNGQLSLRADINDDAATPKFEVKIGPNVDLLVDRSRNILFGGNLVSDYGSSSPNATIRSNGSLETVGDVLIGGTKSAGSNVFVDPNISLNADGTSSFMGRMYNEKSDSSTGSNIRENLLLRNADTSDTVDKSAILGLSVFGPAGENCVAEIRGIKETSSITSASALSFWTRRGLGPSAEERVRINSGGDVLIGDTLPSAPNITLNADGSIQCLQVFADRTAADNFAYGTGLNGSRTSAWLADSTLKLGTNSVGSGEKISLNADGSANFAGNVDTKELRGGLFTTAAGQYAVSIWNESDVQQSHFKNDGSLYIGTNGGGTNPNTTISRDGSASFAGDVTVDGFINSGALDKTSNTAKGCQLSYGGNVNVQREAGNSGSIFSGYQGTSENVTITSDGSASFSNGGVLISDGLATGQGKIEVYRNDGAKRDILTMGIDRADVRVLFQSDGTFALSDAGFATPPDANVHIQGSGSARFAGDIRTGQGSSITDARVPCSFMQAGGGIYTYRSSANSTTPVFQAGVANGTNAPADNVVINADGSARFAGTVTGNFPVNTVVQPDVPAFMANAVSTSDLHACYYARQYTGGGFVYAGANALGAVTFSVNDAGTVTAPNVTFNLEADNDAYYTVTTDSEGVETRVYNGPTLDVKDRVMNLISRLDAIEANELIDDATDTSLLQLVASAAARLDSIEARLTAAGI